MYERPHPCWNLSTMPQLAMTNASVAALMLRYASVSVKGRKRRPSCEHVSTLELRSWIARRCIVFAAEDPVHEVHVAVEAERIGRAANDGPKREIVGSRTGGPLQRNGKVAFHLADIGSARTRRSRRRRITCDARSRGHPHWSARAHQHLRSDRSAAA